MEYFSQRFLSWLLQIQLLLRVLIWSPWPHSCLLVRERRFREGYQKITVKNVILVLAWVISGFSCVQLCATCGLQPIRLFCPWDSPGEKTGVGCHFFLQGIFPTQGWNLTLLVQFSSVSQSCPSFCDSMNHSTQGLPVHHQLLEFSQTHVHQVSDAIQPSHPLSSPSPPGPIPPSIRVFSNESTLRMRWPKF